MWKLMKNGLSVIIPAYNEEHRIEKTLQDYCTFFARTFTIDNKIEIIVVSDGIDRTTQIVKNFSRRYGFVKCLDFPTRLGKGGALLAGFLSGKGKILCFVDADGSIKAKDLTQLLKYLKDEDLDGVIGSRYVEGSEIVNTLPFFRVLLSRFLNIYIRIFLNLNFFDTQCGAKVFKRNVIETCLPHLEFNGYSFDINLLFWATKKRFRIAEVPIRWENSSGSKVTSVDIIHIFMDVLRLWFKSLGDFNASC